MILGLCLGCRGLGWFHGTRSEEWICPGCWSQKQQPKALSPAEYAYLRAVRRHKPTIFSTGDLNYLYSLMVRGSETKKCEGCTEKSSGVEYERSRTMYAKPQLGAWKRLLLDEEGLGEVPDPNQASWLCRSCAKDYHEYWNDMWSNVEYR